MRVVELVNNLEVGGTERLVVDLALALHARGHDVRVVCLRGSGPLATPLEEAGIDVQPLEKSDGPSLRTLLDLNRSLRACRADVVHTHNPLVHHYGVVAGRLARVPAIVNTIHGLGNISSPPGLKEVLYSLSCRASSRVVAVCGMAERVLARSSVIPRAKLVAINNGIPLEAFLSCTPRTVGGQFSFGIVGRLVPVKDHSTLLRAFAQLLSVRPDCRLEILGDGPLRQTLEETAVRLDIAEFVRFRGYSADVAGFMSRIDCLVLCSVSEGLPLSVLEGMAAALPIVGTDVGGMRDLVEGARCGWLCPPSDPGELARALVAAASTGPAELAEMGKRARAHVVAEYSLQRMTERYERLFAELL